MSQILHRTYLCYKFFCCLPEIQAQLGILYFIWDLLSPSSPLNSKERIFVEGEALTPAGWEWYSSLAAKLYTSRTVILEQSGRHFLTEGKK